MTDTPETPAPTLSDAPKASAAERIAKVIARSGVASRRDAEKMILDGRVSVNGKKVTSPALDVLLSDKVVVDGKPIDAPQETRLWLYYKPLGLVTTEKDEQGRRTIFDEMPEGMPRVLNVGRLDLNSEGLLLLTNDGGLKRRLELPETGWLRKYRVRVNGRPMDNTFDPLRRGITIEGEDFQPMEVSLDRQQGANAWLTVGIREGKNREIRRAMGEIGLTVNRLIRVSYGPFRLNDMEPGAVVEVKRKMLRDQLGDRLLLGVEDGKPPRSERMAPKPRSAGMKSHRDEGEERKPFARRDDGDRKPYAKREDGDRKPYGARDGEEQQILRSAWRQAGLQIVGLQEPWRQTRCETAFGRVQEPFRRRRRQAPLRHQTRPEARLIGRAAPSPFKPRPVAPTLSATGNRRRAHVAQHHANHRLRTAARADLLGRAERHGLRWHSVSAANTPRSPWTRPRATPASPPTGSPIRHRATGSWAARSGLRQPPFPS